LCPDALRLVAKEVIELVGCCGALERDWHLAVACNCPRSFGLEIVEGVGTATYLTDGHINLAIIPIGPGREIEGAGVSTANPTKPSQ
jgi:hypothetical protein